MFFIAFFHLPFCLPLIPAPASSFKGAEPVFTHRTPVQLPSPMEVDLSRSSFMAYAWCGPRTVCLWDDNYLAFLHSNISPISSPLIALGLNNVDVWGSRVEERPQREYVMGSPWLALCVCLCDACLWLLSSGVWLSAFLSHFLLTSRHEDEDLMWKERVSNSARGQVRNCFNIMQPEASLQRTLSNYKFHVSETW